MKSCLCCGMQIKGNGKICPRCGVTVGNITCPVCDGEIDKKHDVCPLCGSNIQEYTSYFRYIVECNDLMKVDPELMQIDHWYAIAGAHRFFSAIFSAIGFGVFCFSIPLNWADIVGMCGLAVCLLAFASCISFCVARGVMAKKIGRLLKEKTGRD